MRYFRRKLGHNCVALKKELTASSAKGKSYRLPLLGISEVDAGDNYKRSSFKKTEAKIAMNKNRWRSKFYYSIMGIESQGRFG